MKPFTRNLIATAVIAPWLAAAPLGAQSVRAAKPQPSQAARADRRTVTKVLRIRRGDVRKISRVLQLIGGTVSGDPDLGVIVWTGPERLTSAIEAAAESLDRAPVPAANIELTIAFLAKAGDTAGAPLPADLKGVAQQLHNVFGVEGLRLLETAVVRVRDGGEARVEGTLPTRFGADKTSTYTLSIRKVRLAHEDGKTLACLEHFSLRVVGLRSANSSRIFDAQTDLDVREGQKVVVSRTSMNGFRTGIFVVVSARVVP